MAAAQDGDQRAYRRLLTELTPFLRSVLRTVAEPEDVIQDVLLTVHQVRHTYDPSRPFKPWVTAIARRRAIDRFRRQMRRSVQETELDDTHETIADSGAKQREEDILVARDAARAIAALPPGQRQAIELVKVRELSLKEASAETGLSVSALKVAVHRGMKALRVALGLNADRS